MYFPLMPIFKANGEVQLEWYRNREGNGDCLGDHQHANISEFKRLERKM